MRPFPALLLLLAATMTSQLGAATVPEKIAAAALAQVGVTTQYDPSYVKLSYPNGDVPPHTGVCADVIVRALRKVNVDLQVGGSQRYGEQLHCLSEKLGA